MGSALKKMLDEEKKTARRKSLIAIKDIRKGSVLTGSTILIERPALGLEPRFLDAVVGRRAKRNIKKGEPLLWDMLE